METIILIGAILVGSAISLGGGSLLLSFKKRRDAAILLTMPFGAGALLAAAFFDLLPESLEMANPKEMLLYCLAGFVFFFLLERLSGWFHHHHDHQSAKNGQRWLVVLGDMTHNAIDGAAIGAAFLVSIPTGIITTLAVATHEVPRELGTFAILLSRGWKGKTVILANIATAVATIIMALLVFSLGQNVDDLLAPMLALTSGFFIYVAASDIIPDIHEQPKKVGTIQALLLLFGVVSVGALITVLGV